MATPPAREMPATLASRMSGLVSGPGPRTWETPSPPATRARLSVENQVICCPDCALIPTNAMMIV